VLFSQDGRRIFTGSEDQTARVWNATTGEQIARLNGIESVALPVLSSLRGDVAIVTSERGFAVFRVLTASDIKDAIQSDFPRSGARKFAIRHGARSAPEAVMK
jgi:WD40 repeat protein